MRTSERIIKGFAEAENLKILKAAQQAKDEGIAIPVLLGSVHKINSMIDEHQLALEDVLIIDPKSEEQEKTRERFGKLYFEKRQRRGVNVAVCGSGG